MEFLGFKIHKGEPEFSFKLRSYRGTLLNKKSETEGRNRYEDHDIARWYGVSFGLRWFFGIWIFGDSYSSHEDGPIPTRRR